MREHNFPSCCTAKIYTGMGPTSTADYQSIKDSEGFSPKKFAMDVIQALADQYHEGEALMVFSLNNEQRVADRNLSRLGSTSNPWASSDNHDTLVRVHILRVRDTWGKLCRENLVRYDWDHGSIPSEDFISKLVEGL
ncbi:hypothetical protein AVV32_gp18 [Pseudomonas phage PhiCHU]|uniref:Uncharacterized protein n=1 Tax=Pseudomonas phage PhiCHU TaxID=1589273 RepID=A0A0B5A6F8_9CAUD|nr:hypothetical protein AVV32_gp18 [Pseudomonas phage PhiCHU]AJD82711.1 hypothetical protein PhiCHU_18 [Pseudomonas phage PhiCHU]